MSFIIGYPARVIFKTIESMSVGNLHRIAQDHNDYKVEYPISGDTLKRSSSNLDRKGTGLLWPRR